jgi:hypothetical protein
MAKRKTFENEQNEGAQLSSELVTDRAMVVNLEIMILVGLGSLGRGSHEGAPCAT